MRKIVFFTIAMFGILSATQAQWGDTIPIDTLQLSPRLFCYNCPDTSRYHDSIECTYYESHGSETGYDYNTWYGRDIADFAVYQHTDSPLKVVGIAFSSIKGDYQELRLYDSVMNSIVSDTILSDVFWNMDTSRYDIYALPGKVVNSLTDDISPLTEKIALYPLYFSESIELTGGFWIGISRYRYNSEVPNGQTFPTYIYEQHDPPYRIKNVRYRVLEEGVWREDTVEGSLPELFLIIEPQCHDVEGLTAVMDSLGNVDVTWDSAYNQTQYVVEMHGPGVAVMDTVSECHWHYPLLYPSMAYAVKVKARCFREKDNVWSNWTGTVQFGNTAIDAVEYEPLTVTLTPNPAKDNVTVAAEGYDEAVTVSVTSISGVELIRREKVTLPLTLDTKGLAAGVYMVRVSTAKGTATRRLVVAR